MSEFEKSFFDTSTGAKVRIQTILSTVKPKGIVQIAHGMCEHSGRYERFASFLAQNGYHAVAFDHRGHGETICYGAPLGSFGRENGLEKVIEDIEAVGQHLKETYPELPLIYFGHSMGSILGLNFCVKHSDKIDAAALWNAGVDGGILLIIYNLLLKIERFFKGSDAASTIANKLAFEDWNKKFAPNRTQSDWLTRDETEVDKYLEDPLSGFLASNGLWLEVLKAIKIGADDTQIAKIRNDLNIHMVGGEMDPCCNNGAAIENLAKRLTHVGIKNVKYKIHPENRHEALNELNRDEVMADFVRWLDAQFA